MFRFPSPDRPIFFQIVKKNNKKNKNKKQKNSSMWMTEKSTTIGKYKHLHTV